MPQVTYDQFNAMVLIALGMPVTRNNLDKLASIAVQEGKHGTFNPMNWVRKDAGSTSYNSIGVQNYANLSSGVRQTALGLQQNNTKDIAANLKANAPYADFLRAASKFYSTWGGGNIIIPQTQAAAAGTKPLEGETTQADIDNLNQQLKADPGAAIYVDPLTSNPFSAEGGINPLDAAGTGLLDSPLAIVKTIWSALTNRDNWIRVALVLGAILLAIFGMLTISKSFGGPGAMDVTKGAVKAA